MTSSPDSDVGNSPKFTVPSAAQINRMFSQLEVLELIGAGGMGAVYRARQVLLERDVAIKILPPEIGTDRAFTNRFHREAKTLAQLSHPGIIGVHDFGTAEDLHYIVMEYVDGVNLRQAVLSGNLRTTDVLDIVAQVCQALQYAHENGVAHRDIKPENVLIDKSSRVRVADFGLAKLFDPTGLKQTATQSTIFGGTPYYMAPEAQNDPASADQRADIYSLGVMFYELLTGELPIGRFDPPSKKQPIDERLDGIVLKALEESPENRYQLAIDVANALSDITRYQEGMIRFACSQCGKKLKAAESASGRTVRCSKCGEKMKIPATSLAIPASAASKHSSDLYGRISSRQSYVTPVRKSSSDKKLVLILLAIAAILMVAIGILLPGLLSDSEGNPDGADKAAQRSADKHNDPVHQGKRRGSGRAREGRAYTFPPTPDPEEFLRQRDELIRQSGGRRVHQNDGPTEAVAPEKPRAENAETTNSPATRDAAEKQATTPLRLRLPPENDIENPEVVNFIEGLSWSDTLADATVRLSRSDAFRSVRVRIGKSAKGDYVWFDMTGCANHGCLVSKLNDSLSRHSLELNARAIYAGGPIVSHNDVFIQAETTLEFLHRSIPVVFDIYFRFVDNVKPSDKNSTMLEGGIHLTAQLFSITVQPINTAPRQAVANIPTWITRDVDGLQAWTRQRFHLDLRMDEFGRQGDVDLAAFQKSMTSITQRFETNKYSGMSLGESGDVWWVNAVDARGGVLAAAVASVTPNHQYILRDATLAVVSSGHHTSEALEGFGLMWHFPQRGPSEYYIQVSNLSE